MSRFWVAAVTGLARRASLAVSALTATFRAVPYAERAPPGHHGGKDVDPRAHLVDEIGVPPWESSLTGDATRALLAGLPSGTGRRRGSWRGGHKCGAPVMRPAGGARR